MVSETASTMDLRMREYSISIVREVVREELTKIAQTDKDLKVNEAIITDDSLRRIVREEIETLAED